MGRAEPAEIDELNILHASMLAMERAVKALKFNRTLCWWMAIVFRLTLIYQLKR